MSRAAARQAAPTDLDAFGLRSGLPVQRPELCRDLVPALGLFVALDAGCLSGEAAVTAVGDAEQVIGQSRTVLAVRRQPVPGRRR